MTAIKLQFSSRGSLADAAIKIFDHSIYTHVDAIMSDGSLLGSRDDEEAGIPSGVHVRPDNYATFSVTKIVTLPTTPECASAFNHFLYSQLGKPYDSTAIVAFIVDRDWRKEDSWFCSELIAAALERAKYFSFPLAARDSKITPSDLLLALSATAEV